MDQQQLSFRRESQSEAILRHLQSGAITPLLALQLYGCLRLGGRIYDLRKLGHNIESRMVDVGNGKHVAEYKLVNAETNTQLSIVCGSPEAVAESGLL